MIALRGVFRPFYHGWEHFNIAFTDKKVSDAAQRCFCEHHAQKKSFGQHFAATLLLWIPILNYIVEIALTRLFQRTAHAPVESQERPKSPLPTLPPKTPGRQIKVDDQTILKSDEDVIRYFFKRLVSANNEGKALDAVPFYKQCYDYLLRLHDCQSHAEKMKVIQQAKEKIVDWEGVPKRLKCLALYRLENELVLEKIQGLVTVPFRGWHVLKAPGDGSCMLWSCLLSERIEKEANSWDRYVNVAELREAHPEYVSLHREMMALREEIIQKFQADIKAESGEDFRKEFIYYVAGNPEVSKNVITDENMDDLMLSGRPTPSMIERYCTFIGRKDTWNGEFEAQIVAKIKGRTIIILRGNTDRGLALGTIAGTDYYDTTDKDPIYIRHSGAHYDALFPKQN